MINPFLIFSYAAIISAAIPSALPDPKLTPGAIDPTKTAAILCAKGYTTKSVRPPEKYTNALKRKQMEERHLPGKPSDYELDHLISLELGGDPRSPLNLWPEAYLPKPGAREKDKVEDWLKKQVCSGKMPLAKAQELISHDWISIYKSCCEKRR